MLKTNWILNSLLVVMTVILAIEVALSLHSMPGATVHADSGRYDYLQIVSPVYLYQGNQGVLLLDKRNGNVWFIGKGNEMTITFKTPVFITRLPLDKMDDVPR